MDGSEDSGNLLDKIASDDPSRSGVQLWQRVCTIPLLKAATVSEASVPGQALVQLWGRGLSSLVGGASQP